MVVPVGGVGDILTISKLIYRIGLELKNSPESAPDYQDLLAELEALDRALKEIYTLRPAVHNLRRLDAIRAAAAACQRPLEEFLEKIKKFHSTLGSWGAKRRPVRSIGRSVQ
ncbi:uncharacterized protein Z518_04583 [Rhinocladiella mackenziei CBS 650.93]|uniref:Fungal N-terminal domain-containing protein n=1 Tax=Rhinocladiella mackenziei CBS 650.93 TaxID=1442369 RepID=A0A0D2FWL1_9EURO|nr:uncharacterized protein Z518_04583 [Rhinocladiella mackenziei CBS 650.93]KIX06607.1 hypothetical protein Z518_04583 [Rhinocladiella mackenziei CBS 650.93]